MVVNPVHVDDLAQLHTQIAYWTKMMNISPRFLVLLDVSICSAAALPERSTHTSSGIHYGQSADRGGRRWRF